tara:strand:- start:1272 stop:1502 length:231 start_codon:yes stop_codon:yes gene_type:complete
MNAPNLKIYSCSETVENADFVDINYSAANFFNIPTVTSIAGQNVNVFLSDITINTARLNFSSTYTGIVYYTAISIK